MGHDATKVLMGTTQSSDRDVSDEAGDPATYKAGLAVRRKTTGALSVSSGDGQLIGISMGRSLSDHKKTSVCRAGNRVPLQITNEGDKAAKTIGDLTFTAVQIGAAGNDITIELLDDGAEGSETVDVTDTAILVHMEDGASTAQEIADAIAASEAASALVVVTIAGGEEATAQSESTPAVNLEDGTDDFSYAVPGAVVTTDNTTGKGASSGTTTGACYLANAAGSSTCNLTGVAEDASETDVALIDMGGGL